jgi:hypothetical protein
MTTIARRYTYVYVYVYTYIYSGVKTRFIVWRQVKRYIRCVCVCMCVRTDLCMYTHTHIYYSYIETNTPDSFSLHARRCASNATKTSTSSAPTSTPASRALLERNATVSTSQQKYLAQSGYWITISCAYMNVLRGTY